MFSADALAVRVGFGAGGILATSLAEPLRLAAVITLPLVTALVFLLAEADPVFAAMRNTMEHIVHDDIVSKMVFFVIVFGVTLGECAARASLNRARASSPA
jgi:hypothetical protein